MVKNPEERLVEIFVHGWRNRTNHPTISCAMTHYISNLIGLIRIPKLVPCLFIKISHDLLVLGAVARHDITIRVNEEGVESHVTRKKSVLSKNVVNQAVIKIGTEPFFWGV